MQTKKINDKTEWEEFCLKCKEKTFTQSYNWGTFNELMGDKIWRFGIYENNNLIAIFQLMKTKARRGTYITIPMGPIIKNQEETNSVLKQTLLKTKEIAKQEKADFIRWAPILKNTKENVEIFKTLGLKNAPIHIHPELTWELDITPDEETLLKGMRKTTRYLIRQGIKNNDLEIIKSTNSEDVKEFNNVYKITAERHNFTPFSVKYLTNELNAFKKDNEVLIFLAKYKGEIIASSMIIFWSGIGFYHQGASSQKHPKIPASYLMQWEAIKEAKQRNCKKYNFWGIAKDKEIKDKNHPWAGLTLFKKGFGGYNTEYIKTQDFGLTWKYPLIKLFEKLRKRKRNL